MKLVNVKVNTEMVIEEVPVDADLFTQIQTNRKNEYRRKKIEAGVQAEANKLCNELYVDKTIGEMTSIAAAKSRKQKPPFVLLLRIS